MGYYVQGTGHVVITKANLEKAHEALMALQDAPDSAKRGGAHSGGKQTASWYSWMPEDLRTLPDTKSVFETLGFEVEDSANGDLVIGGYDNKTGQEDVFFAAAAPFIENGEYEWTGEDGAFWEWTFADGKMYRRDGIREYGKLVAVSVPDLQSELAAMMGRMDAALAPK